MSLGPIMLDIDGHALSPADRSLLVEPAVGGVILFSRNYASPVQIADLVADIRALRSPALIVAVDHEGGRVQRFREGFSAIPPMRRIGRIYDSDENEGEQLAQLAGWLIGAELLSVGIDLCFAPCLDLDWGVSEIIGNRAFHRQPEAVAVLAGAFCRGLRSAGMAAVGKHWPGHGAVVPDSHLELPVDRRPYGQLLDDMQPYERLIGNRLLTGVMASHIVYSEMDAAPAGFSAYWLQRELRERMGFDGAVFSDDLSMQATRDFGGIRKRARRSLEAGCDMILICNDRPAAQQAVRALNDYSNPLSLVRLARLHGGDGKLRETLLASAEWQSASEMLQRLAERPDFELNA
ncbi:MAG: beta-N-acetylhexosaminidase [Pseudomonadota bacterium]